MNLLSKTKDMASFEQKFTVHPIGQGLFYSGKIRIDGNVRFRMVFDCGSVSKDVDEEIDLYRDGNFVNEGILDLLVISHFDADHVNKIGALLAGGIKIKRLVMPFATFTERLFLALRCVSRTRGYKPEDDYLIRLIIDPLGTLSSNLDDDSEYFWIESDPESPILPVQEATQDSGIEWKNESRFEYNFEPSAKESLNDKEIRTSPLGPPKGYKVKDSSIGIAELRSSFKLMEFLFYRRRVTDAEEEFYKRVEELFYREYGIDPEWTDQELIEATTQAIKSIKAAKPIKKMFETAKREIRPGLASGVKIDDLNTTALCLLHRNLKGIYRIANRHSRFQISQIQKFISKRSSRVEIRLSEGRIPIFSRFWYHGWFVFPNVLLTSDSFLKSTEQVAEFETKYQNYWNDFWLFQIPHHGSEKNSDRLLFSILPGGISNFINYGVGNKYRHPSATLITDLVVTGQTLNLFAISQYSGLNFVLHLHGK